MIDLDIKGFFDNLDHELMMKAVRFHTEEKWIHLYVERWLKAPLQQEDGQLVKRDKGTPQGGVISPLLANIFMHHAFDEWMERHFPYVKFERFADDALLHCQSLRQAEKVLEAIKDRLKECGLELHPEKTKIVDMRKLKSAFDFLGFSFKKVKGFRGRGQYVKVQPSKKSQAKLKETIRDIVKHRTSLKLGQLIAKVNPVLRGWHNYFKVVGYPRQVFFKMDWFVVGRFYRWSKKRSQRGSKYLTQDAWKKLRYEKLMFLQPCCGRRTVKVIR